MQLFTWSGRCIGAKFTLPDYKEYFLTLVKSNNAYIVAFFGWRAVGSEFHVDKYVLCMNFLKLISFSTIQFAIGISKHILQTSIWLLKFTINISVCLYTEYLAGTNMTLQETVAFFFYIFFFKYLMKYTYYQVKSEQIKIKKYPFLISIVRGQ